ncbi:hypothetical protein M3Y98_00172100 [Aphelenchoides besseyi]|nr:hypothetical protein M3Y98_00172100 [Aphelenchoides besseyi]
MKILEEIVPSDELKDALVDYLKCISSDVEEEENDAAEDSSKEIVELHVKRDELLLRGGSTNYNPNDPHSSCHAQLLEMGRQRRVNTINNRLEDMRENIRTILELNQKLEAMVEQQKGEVGLQPMQWFVNDTNFHDAAYAEVLRAVGSIPEDTPPPVEEYSSTDEEEPATNDRPQHVNLPSKEALNQS